jgi:organic hydroperoxide reductase OsmC/OhrA
MLKPEKILFRAEMKATGGREGVAVSPDRSFRMALSVPKGLGGQAARGPMPSNSSRPAMLPAFSVR